MKCEQCEKENKLYLLAPLVNDENTKKNSIDYICSNGHMYSQEFHDGNTYTIRSIR